MNLERRLGGVRGTVTRTTLVVTALTLTVVGVLGSISLARLAERDIDRAIVDTLDEVEQRYRAGDRFVSLTHPSGVEVLVDRTFRDTGSTDQIVRTRPIVVDDTEVVLSARVTTRGLDSTLRTIRRTLWLLVPLAAALTALVANLAVRRSLRPVSEITDEAERIAAGTGSGRVPVPDTGDEIEQLAETVNMMLDAADAARERQRRFVSDASHELRTPLMVLSAEADLARRHPDGVDLAAFAATVETQTNRLDRLTDDLLMSSSIAEQHAEHLPVDLAAIVGEEIDAAGFPVAVTRELVSPVEVTGDAVVLRRAVRNILANARRHADRAVRVELSMTTGLARLAVEDDGPGIAPPDRGRVFERFARLDDARARDTGGAGLGLAIVAEAAARHGGRAVAVDPRHLDGARIELDLPLV